ncbi:protein kinase domain-containing protein [Nonomuraea polychroma]|uniref:serine/threonine protein kinase n=1 Tax=Nonomuraea polychroma TaxID=46176 RepID=UPI003D912372
MHPLRPGDPEKLGEYVISGRLTDGPRGTAYLGQESDDAPLRVIKLLPAAPEQGGDAIARLTGVQRVSSSYIARTLEAGRHADRPYVVREYVEGRSLAEIVVEDGPLDADALERVAVGVLTALTAVHLAGITHRGLTPHNVIIGANGTRVTDVDLGEPTGEAGYRAPEQLRQLGYGPYADVFAWAATVVFAATGKPPFGQDAEAVLNGQPEVGNLGEPLRRVVLSALAKEIAPRPTTYMALLQLLGDKRGGARAMAQKQPRQPDAPIVGVPVPGVPVQGAPVPGVPVEGMPPQAGPPTPPQQQTWGPPSVPEESVQGGPSPVEGVPVPPPTPTWEPPQLERQTTVPGQTVPSRSPRKFPLGLAAAVGALVLLSGVGLWGASRYASTQRFEPVAAAVGTSTEGPAAAGGSEKAAAQQGQPEQRPDQPVQDQPEVTVPWADTSNADPDDVGPMVLPTDWTSQAPTPPELSTVPTPVPITTQPVTQATSAAPTVTVTQTPTPSPTQSPTPDLLITDPTPTPTPTLSSTPTPAPTVTVTVMPVPTVTVSVKPTTKPTAKPTISPTAPKPSATKTTQAPKPTMSSPPPPMRNPYSPVQVCGPGFSVQRSQAFASGETFQLYNVGTGENCVVTMKTTNVGRPTNVSATLEVQGVGSRTDSGVYEFYAGPVKLRAKGKCVRFSGGAGSFSTGSNWGNCG